MIASSTLQFVDRAFGFGLAMVFGRSGSGLQLVRDLCSFLRLNRVAFSVCGASIFLIQAKAWSTRFPDVSSRLPDKLLEQVQRGFTRLMFADMDYLPG